jgi:O-antigen/teichoic acid export membrane protein
VILGLLAAPVVETLYGDQWRAAVPLLQIMCAGALVSALTSISSDALTGIGRIREVFRITATLAVLKIALILAAAPFGLIWVVTALLVTPVIDVILVYRQTGRHLRVRLPDLFPAVRSNAMLSAISATPAAAAVCFFGWTLGYSIALLLVVLSACALAWLAGVYWLKPPLYREIQPLMRRLMQRRPV